MSDDIQRMHERLDELAGLKLGWYGDGDGEPLAPEGLAWARALLVRLIEARIIFARPRLYPTPDGGLQAEWDWPEGTAGTGRKNFAVELEINLQSRTGTFFAFDMPKDDSVLHTLLLDVPEGETFLRRAFALLERGELIPQHPPQLP